MSAYQPQDSSVLIGTKTTAGTRTGVALTTAYQSETGSTPTKSFKTSNYSRVAFAISYTMGSAETANTIETRLDWSPDNVNWYRIANDSTSGATSTLTAREFVFTGTNAAEASISIIMDISYPFMRIACKESGVAANAGNVFVEATLTQV